jgi:peptide deformylase
MTILKVLTIPDPILRQIAVDVTVFDERLETVVNDMYESTQHYVGVGLAAPQVGISENIIVISFEGKNLTLINPKIIEMDDVLVQGEEGCLSVPENIISIDRADKIVVKAQDIKGNHFKIKKSGWFSRIIQHEMDHLKGILILDHL